MHRSLAICLALILATVSIATAGFAAEVGALRFEVRDAGKDRVQLTLRRDSERQGMSSSTYEAGELAGLDRAALNGRDGSPVRFSLVREPGRLDCAGTSEDRRAKGNCRFTGDQAFASYLVASGIRRPTDEEWLTLTTVGARRSLVEALKQGRYDMPSPNTLAGMTALGVSPEYIRELAANGYRPRRTEDFLPLRALNVTPDYIRSLKSVGYDRIPVDELIQLKAMDVTADFIASYQRRGFRNLPVSRLVQLKALGIRPDEIDSKSVGQTGSLAVGGGASLMMSAVMP